MELKDQDVIMDSSNAYLAFTRIGSTKTKISAFMRRSAFDPRYRNQFDQMHRVQSKLRQQVIQEIKEKQKPLE